MQNYSLFTGLGLHPAVPTIYAWSTEGPYKTTKSSSSSIEKRMHASIFKFCTPLKGLLDNIKLYRGFLYCLHSYI